MARPPRVPGARIVKLSVWMTEEERALLQRAAQLHAQSCADYIRVHVGHLASEDIEQLALRLGDRRQRQMPVSIDRRSGRDRRAHADRPTGTRLT